MKNYENLDEDPMLMLERDESPSVSLRIGGSSKKEEKKKAGFNRKMTQQPFHEENFDESNLNDSQTPDDLEQLDQILNSLSEELQSFGFPDCGNLRSTKRKDVR